MMHDMQHEKGLAPLGHPYTKVEGFRRPFEKISLDPLGYLRIQAFPNSRKVVRNYPLAIKCLSTGCLEIFLMEDMSTEQVILGLLRLEARYGRITKLARDAGTNMMVGLNPMTKDGKRLFEIIIF